MGSNSKPYPIDLTDLASAWNEMNAYKDEAEAYGARNALSKEEINAFAHAYASAMFTTTRGAAAAKQLGDWREQYLAAEFFYSGLGWVAEKLGIYPLGDPRADSFKDLWNNQVGREIGNYAAGHSLAKDQVQELVRQAVRRPDQQETQAIVSVKDPRIPEISNAWMDPQNWLGHFLPVPQDGRFNGHPDDYRGLAPEQIWTPPSSVGPRSEYFPTPSAAPRYLDPSAVGRRAQAEDPGGASGKGDEHPATVALASALDLPPPADVAGTWDGATQPLAFHQRSGFNDAEAATSSVGPSGLGRSTYDWRTDWRPNKEAGR